MSAWPPWAVMWVLAGSVFAACKWLTWSQTQTPRATVWRHFGYLFAWPGLDAPAFFDPLPLVRDRRPAAAEWTFAAGKLCLGIALTWGVARVVPAELPLARGWVGMAGIIFVLHFGLFHILSCAWRASGVDAKPLMN